MPSRERKQARVKTSGAEALIQALGREGVRYIFGLPGGAILPVYDKFVNRHGLRHILVRHEQVGAHMAEGYARASGEVGVCMATSGPGATNLMTGIADAMLDSVPIVAITGQVPTNAIGSDAFQEADTFGISMPIVKHSFSVKDVRRIPEIVHQAIYLASSGRPGPVLIDFPKDVATGEYEFDFDGFKRNSLPGYRLPKKCDERDVRRAVELLSQARRPIIYAGGGVISSGAHRELKKLAELTRIPVTNTLMGLGGFPGDHPQFLGMVGMHGTVAANYALNHCDVMLAVGVRFDDRVTGKLEKFAPEAKVIHIDIDESEIHKNRYADVPLHGDAKAVLKQLLDGLKPPKNLEPWWRQIEEWLERYPLRFKQNGELKPQWVMKELNSFFKGMDPIITTGVGQHQMWAAQYMTIRKPRHWISSSGLGTMGFGFPAAMGAKIAKPKKTVICIDGDGSFQMVLQDLATAVVNRLGIKIFLFNNQYLGMVRQWQELFFNRRYSNVCMWQTLNCHPWCNTPGPDKCPSPTPDFVKLMEAYGGVAIRVRTPEELAPALKKSTEVEDLPVLVDIWVSPEENVYPMIPAGGSVEDLIPCPS